MSNHQKQVTTHTQTINSIFKKLYCEPQIHFATHTKLFDLFYDKEAELKKKNPLQEMMEHLSSHQSIFYKVIRNKKV